MNFFSLIFPAPTLQDFDLIPFNTGGQDLAFCISGNANSLILSPSQKISFLIKPVSLALSDSTISGMLNGVMVDNVTTGVFYGQIENQTTTRKSFKFVNIHLPKIWENTTFNVAWLDTVKMIGYRKFGKDATSVYSFPHNLHGSEIKIQGNAGVDESVIDYKLFFPLLVNESDVSYSGYHDRPYKVFIEHTYPDQGLGRTPVSGFSEYMFYSVGSPLSGISFSLPFYDMRSGWKQIPANYTFNINYNSAGPIQPASSPLRININHAKLKDNFFVDLTTKSVSSAKIEDLQEVNTLDIPANIISRRRLAIGVEDIKCIERTFKKNGTFVSNSYNVDFSIYNFSMVCDEVIPSYASINKFDTVKYFVSFNNGEWFRISPVNRSSEFENNDIVPKLIIFDISNFTESSSIKFVDSLGIVNSFRVKIIFDLSQVTDALFIPPEVRSYKCILYDKEHFVNFEV